MMQGLQVFDANGNLDIDITHRIPRFLGITNIPANQPTGRIVNAGILPETDIWWFLLNATTNFSASYGDQVTYEYPTITKGNGYLYWNFPSGRNISCTLLYGVY